MLTTDEFAVAVVQVTARQRVALAAGEFTTTVVQVPQVADAQLTGGGDQAVGVVQVAHGAAEVDGNGAAEQRAAVLVVQARRVDVQVLAGVDQSLVLIVELAGNPKFETGATGQGAAVVVQATGLHIDVGRRDQAFDVGQRLLHAQGHGLIAEQFAVAVVEAVGRQRERLGTGYFAVAVVHLGEVFQHQCRGIDQTVLVIQLTVIQVQGQRRVTGELPAIVLVEAADTDRQGLVAGDPAFAAVIDLTGVEAQAVEAGQFAALVVHRPRGGDAQGLTGVHQPRHVIQRGHAQRRGGQARELASAVVQVTEGGVEMTGTGDQTVAVEDLIGREVEIAAAQHPAVVLVVQSPDGDVGGLPGAQRAALIVQGLAGVNRQIAAGHHALASVGEILRIQVHITAGIAAGIGVDPGFDDAVVGQYTTGRQRDAVPGGEGLLVGQVALGLHVDGGAGVDRATRIETGGFDIDGACGRGLRQAEMAVGVELDITTAGGQVAIEFHPDPGLGTHQFDRPGVHATQRRGVDRQLWFGTAVIGAGGGVEAVGVDVVATGDDGQVLRLNLGVDLRAAGDDFKLVDVVGVQPGAVDGDAALIDLEAIQTTTTVQHRFAGGQGHARGVDEAAAVATDAVGVGHDDPCRLPRHFGVTAQLAGAAADHFVEDGLRGDPVGQVGVADDDPAQLRRAGLVGDVVEDDALGADVVIVKLVMRQPRAVGRGDLDNRHPVARLPEAGAGRSHHDPVGLGPYRLPEHDVGQQERQPALGHAPEVLTVFDRSRGLASEEGVVANVHVSVLEEA
ncbi:hypothetical protein SRABI123_05730 [Pseudomonas sp. Bi123]|nr:hypothetical protein SRABI123_05730 [Pseudomonas sp. Bi123]